MHPAYLSLSNLSVGYHGQAILSNLNLSANRGELVALIGRNGIGKSTLMRTIARLQSPVAGKVMLDNKPIDNYSNRELSALLSIVSTENVGAPYLSVQQLVAYGRFPYTNWIGKITRQDVAVVNEAMQWVGISHLTGKKIQEISDGERQRAMIARTLAQDTGLILLDEPTAFLDMPNKYEIIRLLHRFTRKNNKTILFSTHDLNIAMQEADKLWLIVGETLYEGAPEDLVLNGQLSHIFEGSNLSFDDKKGEFKIKRTEMKSVCLVGNNGKTYFWTKKALERLGFKVSADLDAACKVYLSDELPSWNVHYNERNATFTSIYDMSQYLTEIS